MNFGSECTRVWKIIKFSGGACPQTPTFDGLNSLVSFPDPDPRAGKGLVTFAQFIGCVSNSIDIIRLYKRIISMAIA